MGQSNLATLLEQMRAQTDRLRAEGKEATRLRLKWERQRTDDPELIKKLDRALAGEITWLNVMTSAEYEKAHAAEYEEAQKDFEQRRADGTLPSPAEAETGLEEFLASMRADVEAAEQAESEQAGTEADARKNGPEWVYRPKISDR